MEVLGSEWWRREIQGRQRRQRPEAVERPQIGKWCQGVVKCNINPSTLETKAGRRL